MSHHSSPYAGVASWQTLAVAGLLAGLLAPPAPTTPGPTTPNPTPPTTAGPTPTAAPSAVPTATAATGALPTATVTPTPTFAVRVVPPRRPTPSRSPTPGVVVDDSQRGIAAGWTSYLPTPETGRKIFAAGLLGLTVAIAGLAALAIRRRNP